MRYRSRFRSKLVFSQPVTVVETMIALKFFEQEWW